jgi:AcrR family transcriptional regulator
VTSDTSLISSRERDGRAARWAGQRERRRTELVDAALTAIAEYGPDVSVETISTVAGMARTQVYRHFDDNADLQRSISGRIASMLIAELEPVFQPYQPPMEMIRLGVRTHLNWLCENTNLYRFATTYAPAGSSSISAALMDAISSRLVALFELYLGAFGLCYRYAEPTSYGVVGMLEAATARWLDRPGDLTVDELAEYLTTQTWNLIEIPLRAYGIELAPDEAPPRRDEIAASG